MIALILAPEASAFSDTCIIVAWIAHALVNLAGIFLGLPLFLGDTPTFPSWTAVRSVLVLSFLSLGKLNMLSLYFAVMAFAEKACLPRLFPERLLQSSAVVAFQAVNYRCS